VTVTSASGGAASASTSATIQAGTAAAGTPTANPGGPYTGTQNSPIAFNGSASSDPNGLTLTYNWDFGDGTTGTDVGPTHAYPTGATYSIALTVWNGTTSNTAGTTAKVTGPTLLTVNAGGPYSIPANKPLTLNGTNTSNPNSRQLSYLLDFGDGATSVGAQPIHIYKTQGSYNVWLAVTDGLISGNGSATVAVGAPAPETITAAAGGPYAETTGRTVTFDASASTDSTSNPLTYTWDFGDGTTGSGVTPGHAYASKGTYTATVTAASGAVTGTATAQVVVAQSITVTVTSPTKNTLYGGSATATVAGTVSAPNLTVNVNGVAASVSGMNFTATGVTLREGVNLLVATAMDNSGGVGTGAVSVILDATAPTVAITSPSNGSTVTTPSVTVAGLVNDIVTGTIGSTNVAVKVNRAAAQVSNRSFSLASQLLTSGANTITATAVGNVGNTSAASVTVYYTPPAEPAGIEHPERQWADGRGGIGAAAAARVQLVAADGTPVVERPVTFTVTRSDGQVEVAPTLYVTTDNAGKTSVLFQVGSRAGLAVNQVSATTPGASGAVMFTANSTNATPTQIHIVRGASQRGMLGEPLAGGL
jgi:PKD repeat protein